MSGPFGSGSLQFFSGGGDFYPYEPTGGLRFEDGDSAYLYRTPGTAGNRRTWTFSCWFKRGNLGLSSSTLFGVNDSATGLYNVVNFQSDDTMYLQVTNGSSAYYKQTSRVFRDTGAWYHLVWSVDTTQSTAADRVKVYINGVEETNFSTSQNPSQNAQTDVNNTQQHRIGSFPDYSSREFDGYMSEIYLVDGTAHDADAFGELKNGVWVPKDAKGSLTFGTNGFYLPFDDSGAIGDDESGNGNDFTTNGLAATDVVPDSPTNNFCTMNPLNWDVMTFAEGNLKISTTTNNRAVHSTFALPSSGKWIYEFEATDYTSGGGAYIGFSNNINKGDNEFTGDHGIFYQTYNGGFNVEGTVSTATGYSTGSVNFTSDGDIHTIAIDVDNQKLYFAKNGTWRNSADPGAGTGGLDISTCFTSPETDFHACITRGGSFNESYTFNFGQDDSFAGGATPAGNTDENGHGSFSMAVPSGFLALCTANLPEPDISPADGEEPADYFNTVLYTGTGSSNAITGVGFGPDWTWVKRRSASSTHKLMDVVRGDGNTLATNNTNAETDDSSIFSSLDSDGFTVTGNTNSTNASGGTYVAWNWLAGGTAVSNTDGTITSSVSANTKAGFSIVSYTGNATAGATVGHGLNSTPEMYIVKSRSLTTGWVTYHKDAAASPEDGYLVLSGTDAFFDTVVWNDTAPTSSVFSLGGSGYSSNNSGATYIAYCFHSVEGYSKVGSYTGNGSSDGPFVHCGFRPAWVMVKGATISSNWFITDGKRDTYNVTTNKLTADTNSAESSNSGLAQFDMLSNGFKHRQGSGTGANNSGETYIFIAFAESPFKYAQAR